MILVSACLCGDKCKYNGSDNINTKVVNLCKKENYIKICPEVFGGLTIPRIPAEILGGTSKDVIQGKANVINKNGEDVTNNFLQGAFKVINEIKDIDIDYAVLKSKSPSCGKGLIYDGTFTGKLIDGNGIMTQLLIDSGIVVKTEDELEE